ncbi:MAG: 1-acyl-sn-glycerol-3-phosphate acyltransferase [Clostridia bacterium]|nr:1-acyl-sn-glycerol-3-phosphate acyltransferase [Clostridia bacterium]
MKIKVKKKSYQEVMSLPQPKHIKPMRQSFFFRLLLRVVSAFALIGCKFSVKKSGMDKLGKKEPCLFLMNHSSFIDLEIASVILFPRRFSIVCTSDGFIGKNLLMRLLGCIPTKKFIFDLGLIRDMTYAIRALKSSILLFPEAGYTFDGTTTTLPENLGSFVKMLGVPVVMIETQGAFARQPLYNNLKKRHVKVSAEMRYLLSADDCAQKEAQEIQKLIEEQFSFDAFRNQQEKQIKINEPYRAEGLERVLYKCPACLTEGKTDGKGTALICHACGKRYTLDEHGFMRADTGKTEFPHIPDWYAWERDCVAKELKSGEYRLDCDVKILMLVNTKCLYDVGDGRLVHTREGFHLTGSDGSFEYTQKPISSYSLNSDFNWYEIGDIIGIGNPKALYYCFPKDQSVSVAKARLAAEELYKIVRKERIEKRERNNEK